MKIKYRNTTGDNKITIDCDSKAIITMIIVGMLTSRNELMYLKTSGSFFSFVNQRFHIFLTIKERNAKNPRIKTTQYNGFCPPKY
jgi:hypothetical protein